MKGLEDGDHLPTKSPRLRSVIACIALCALALVVFIGGSSHSQEVSMDVAENIIRGNSRKLQQVVEDKKGDKKQKKADEKQQSKKQKNSQQEKQASICDAPDYANTTLKLISEMHMDFLFPNRGREKVFEGSDVVHVDDFFYVVFDNLYSIGKIDANNNFSSTSRNYLLPQSRTGKSGSSGYEAIAFDEVTRQYYVVIESEPTASASVNHGVAEQMRITDQSLMSDFVQRCESEYVFTSENKGFEGAAIVRVSNRMYMVGLCEGNFCMGGNKGKDPGNGRLLVMQRRAATTTTPCSWRTVREINLPATASFQDYSGLALRKTNTTNTNGADVYDIAITSQENSQLWVGKFTVGPRLDLADWELSTGSVYNFPRDPYNCGLMYCSVEGIAFLDKNKLVAVSDQGGGTASGCSVHDENIHIFQLP